MRWFDRKKKKRKIQTITKKNLMSFLKEVATSVDQTFSGQESEILQKILEKELDHWLKNTIFKNQPLNSEDVKVGICLGLMEALRKINESEEKETNPFYIS